MSQDTQKNENKELGKLININEDACEFYETAQEKAENFTMKQTFSQLEKLHKGVIISLQQQVRANGGDPEADETLMGGARQFFGELAANISNDVDETLVKHLEEAEDRCLHSIEDALTNDNVTAFTKSLLQKELSTLQATHDYMKSLKEQMQAA